MKHDMARIILITGNFQKLDKYGHTTGETEFITSHGVNEDTGEHIVVSQEHPKNLGGKFDTKIDEWVLEG